MCEGSSVCSSLESLVQPLACFISPRQHLEVRGGIRLETYWWFNRKLKIRRPWSLTWQYQLEHVTLLFLLVCFLQAKMIYPHFLTLVQEKKCCIHTRCRHGTVCTWACEQLRWKMEPFQSVLSLPNVVWLHLGAAAWPFAPENMSCNSYLNIYPVLLDCLWS